MNIRICLLLLGMAMLLGCRGFKHMADYKLRDGSEVEFYYEGGGATAPSGIRVRKKNSDTVIDELPKFDYTYVLSFKQIDDTLLKVILLDTSYFKGHVTERIINLNKRMAQ
jgi:hypothetical protein